MEVLKKGVEVKMDGLKNNMDALKKDMEAKMDGMEEKMKDNMENMKNDLKVDIESLTKLIQEMFPNGEKIVKEIHDENKTNVNHDFIKFDVRWKNHHIPKTDMRKFDSKDLVT